MALVGKDKFLRTVEDNANRLIRGLALEGMGRLIEKTPVDTGRAKNNWNLATGSPDASNLPEGQYPRGGTVALTRMTGQAGAVKAGDIIYLTNALPYIGPLENGHSRQAPSGMIALTVRELQPLASEIAAKVRGG